MNNINHDEFASKIVSYATGSACYGAAELLTKSNLVVYYNALSSGVPNLNKGEILAIAVYNCNLFFDNSQVENSEQRKEVAMNNFVIRFNTAVRNIKCEQGISDQEFHGILESISNYSQHLISTDKSNPKPRVG